LFVVVEPGTTFVAVLVNTVPVPAPAGVVADPAGNVYVSANSMSTGTGDGSPGTDGQVWRLSRRSF
jgi:hypothetical protein